MPGHPIHRLLTETALHSLPPPRRECWKEVTRDLGEDYCMYPDNWYAYPEGITPYLCFTDGVPFHYPPNEAVVYNNWEVIPGKNGERATLRSTGFPVNEHHRHCRRAFEFYLGSISEALLSGRMDDAAKFAGAISHTLQDNTTPIHCTEGMDGADIMVLDRYMQPPEDKPEWTPSRLFGRILVPLDLGELGEPDLAIGNSPEEAGFLFYTEFCRVVARNRLRLLPLLQAAQAGEEATWKEILRAILREAAKLNALFLNTCHDLADLRANPSEAKRRPVYLSDLRPSVRSRYLSAPYREKAFVQNHALDPNGSFAPLELEWESGRMEGFSRGLGMGAHADFLLEHELPAGVYQSLHGAIGLHARFGREGKVAMRWELNDQVLWEDRFGGSHLAADFQVTVKDGGILRLRGFSLTGKALDPANHVVLGAPVLE